MSDKDDKIIDFKTAREQAWRAQYAAERRGGGTGGGSPEKKEPPFFNFEKIPPFTRTMVGAFIVVQFILAFLLDPPTRFSAYELFGFTPAIFTGARPWDIWALITPVTHVFIHGGWMHLLFNGVMMLALGTLFEKSYGLKRAATLFFVSSAAGAALYLVMAPFTTHPVIGASAGISGLFGAALLILQEQRDNPWSKFGVRFGGPPWKMIAFWVGFMALFGILMGGVAWQAHIGGFIAGIAFVHILRKRLR